MSDSRPIKRALLSVSDKTGIVEFARALVSYDVTIISTGGTAAELRNAGLSVVDVSDVTGFPEMMGGRVKTLHPKIHGGLLALRDDEDHVKAMTAHGIEAIDLVVINLYPFEKTVDDPDVSLEVAVENIDIGGPAMIRSAAKNWRDVAVVTDPALYKSLVEEMGSTNGSLSLATRQRLAVLAYTRTAAYDLSISSFLAGQLSEADLELLEPHNPLAGLMFIESEELEADLDEGDTDEAFPETFEINFAKAADLRYGENPHQKAALYTSGRVAGIAAAEQLHGKEMSFNNYVDADAALRLIREFDGPAAAIIKHTNPSGLGTGSTLEQAYQRALSTDPVSAFGGIVAFNRKVDAATAASVTQIFTEVVLAPEFDDDALELFRSKKNLRVLRVSMPSRSDEGDYRLCFKQISGGMLVQTEDDILTGPDGLKIVTEKQPTPADLDAMDLAWKVCKHVKSNAIVIADAFQTIGVGSGQMNRIDSLRIAAIRAERFGLATRGAALASDAFFPFRDSVDEAAKLGISAIIQPGGSLKDDESIAAANEHGIVMAFTGVRHFDH